MLEQDVLKSIKTVFKVLTGHDEFDDALDDQRFMTPKGIKEAGSNRRPYIDLH